MTSAELRLGTETVSLLVGKATVLADSPLFAVEVDGKRYESLTDARTWHGGAEGLLGTTGVHASWSARRLGNHDAWELRLDLENRGDSAVTVRRMDPLAAQLGAPADWNTLYFRSAWGDEFRPERGTTRAELRLDSRSGRSSHGTSPWLGLERDGAGLVIAPAWSGNWHISVLERGRLFAGISPWLFSTTLGPAEKITAPSVVISAGADLDAAALALTSAVGAEWVPRSPASDALPVEWNHWWPYEDAEVNEETIWQNAQIAAQIGMGVSTVDAGWFGDADASSDWQEQRGDWHRTNTVRFPSGLRALGDGIRSRGTKAGIWLEPEAVGRVATLRTEHPEIIAHTVPQRRPDPSYRVTTVSLDPEDPSFLGYVCLGSPGGREHVTRALNTTVCETGAEWLKLDFNIDPDAGCTRTDHGHGAEDGLFRHYEGLYSVLDEFRAAHPEVIVEACASGGLRVDLGLARHVHCLFLSDPDYTEHHLQVLWGASLLLPPVSILHWSWSQWRGDYQPSELDFGSLPIEEFDTTLRAAMLHRFGVSLRLPELSEKQLESLRAHTAIFSNTIAPFVRNGTLRRLTAQPQRGGAGERVPAFQLTLGDRHIVAGFRLSGGETPTALVPRGAYLHGDYRVTDLVTGVESVLAPSTLNSRGVPIMNDEHDRTSSWLLLLEPIEQPQDDQRRHPVRTC